MATYYKRDTNPTNNNWAQNDNWSTVASNSATNTGTFPVAGDTAIFGAGSIQCTVASGVPAATSLLTMTNYNNTLTLNDNLTVSSTCILPSGASGALAGAGTLKLSGTQTITSNGKTIPNLEFTTAISTKTFSGDASVTGLTTITDTTILTSGTLNMSGGLTVNANVSGTTTLAIKGGTWQSGASNRIVTNPIRLDGNFTLGATTAAAGNITWVSGTIDTSTNSNKMYLTGVGSINTASIRMSWYDLYVTGSHMCAPGLTVANTLYVPTSSAGALTSGSYIVGNGINLTGPFSGGDITLTGGTWSTTVSAGVLSSNLVLAGNITVTGTVYYSTGTLTYTSGTIDWTGATLSKSGTTIFNLGSSCKLNNFSCGSGNITLTGDFYVLGLFNAGGTVPNFVCANPRNIVLSGSISGTGGGITAPANTQVTLNGTGTIAGGFLFTCNLDFNTTGTLTFNAGLTRFSGMSGATLSYVYTKGTMVFDAGQYLSLYPSLQANTIDVTSNGLTWRAAGLGSAGTVNFVDDFAVTENIRWLTSLTTGQYMTLAGSDITCASFLSQIGTADSGIKIGDGLTLTVTDEILITQGIATTGTFAPQFFSSVTPGTKSYVVYEGTMADCNISNAVFTDLDFRGSAIPMYSWGGYTTITDCLGIKKVTGADIGGGGLTLSIIN